MEFAQRVYQFCQQACHRALESIPEAESEQQSLELSTVEKATIAKALARCKGDKLRAAKVLGIGKTTWIPHWALKKRARELGLTRTKESAWSEPELEILAHYAWMSDERLRIKLKAAGYTRTATAIHLKLKRMTFKKDGGFYSANSLAQALGIDPHAVTRWINRGSLKATLRGTARGERQNGDIYLIREQDVRRFVLEHPTDIDLRKVHQLWFLDMVTNGLAHTA